jgi:AGCS family alanine or glycine:cation symporter
MIGWCVYGEKSVAYLTNNNKLMRKVYILIYVLSIFFGALLKVDLIWNLADIFNGLMAIPNLIALIALSKIVKEDSIKELNLE